MNPFVCNDLIARSQSAFRLYSKRRFGADVVLCDISDAPTRAEWAALLGAAVLSAAPAEYNDIKELVF
jgi:hypothetical protein